ncbi:serine hydrolase domain-containing protein [Aggregatimonas sangjinii]|nr:serine hydrolase domain-containing protein [Aggregatimonas sangjinii]
MKKQTFFILLHFLICLSFGQSDDAILKTLHTDLERIYAQDQITGFSVAIVNQDGIVFEKGLGYADRQAGKKYTENTVQNIASISKTFIGIALLKAEELGKLHLDDPVNDYLDFKVINPHFPDVPITIRHLATHTSSIKDAPEYESKGYILRKENNGDAKVNKNFRPPAELMVLSHFLEEILSDSGAWYKKKNFLKNAPGELFEYSNIGAGLAALVLEEATGVPFNEFTASFIFKPLGMSDSGWFLDEVNFSNYSKLYSDTEKEMAPYQLVNYPDGGLITSSHDLGLYLTELISGFNGTGNILTDESYEKLFTPYLTAKNFKERNESVYNDEYNMGIFMGISAHGQIGHTGGDPGVATYMFFNTKTRIGKILMVNTDIDKEGVKEFSAVWKKLEEYETKF